MKKCIRCQTPLADNYPERMCPDCMAWLNEKTGGKGKTDVFRKPPASAPAPAPAPTSDTNATGTESRTGARSSDYGTYQPDRPGKDTSGRPKSKLPMILGIVAAAVVFGVLAFLLLNKRKPGPGPASGNTYGTGTVLETQSQNTEPDRDPELETYAPSGSSDGSADSDMELQEYITSIHNYVGTEDNRILAGDYQEVKIRDGLISYWDQDNLVKIEADADEQYDADREYYYSGGDLLYADYLGYADIYLTDGQILCIKENGGEILANSGDWGKWPGYVYGQEAVYREEAYNAKQGEADKDKLEEEEKKKEEEEKKKEEERKKQEEEEEEKRKEEEEKKKKEEEEKKKKEEEEEKDSNKSFDSTCRALSDRVFSDDEIRKIKEDAPDNLPERPYQMAINYLYAIHGYHFNTDSIRDYFNKQSWYDDKGRDMGACEAEMSSTEKENKKKLETYR